MSKGVLLLSGGMDSTTLLGKLLLENWSVYPIIFDYGQRHRAAENEAAKRVWDFYKKQYPNALFPFKTMKLDLGQIGNSALTDFKIAVPNNMAEQAKTVVPFRNSIMLLHAAGYAESLGIYDLFITPVAEDFASYEDCREYTFKTLESYMSMASKGQKAFNINIPYVNTWKKELVAWGLSYGVPYELSHSCYNGVQPACGTCPACVERLASFRDNGVKDPIAYVGDNLVGVR
jgi:7-cyano-7-deazaguanine synthase